MRKGTGVVLIENVDLLHRPVVLKGIFIKMWWWPGGLAESSSMEEWHLRRGWRSGLLGGHGLGQAWGCFPIAG